MHNTAERLRDDVYGWETLYQENGAEIERLEANVRQLQATLETTEQDLQWAEVGCPKGF